jgi:cobalt/nickel transport system ATP-binding protein
MGEYAVEIVNLWYAYPDGNKALNGLSLRITHGEKVALIGRNGAGKSTLLMHLNGVLRGNGKIVIDGIELTDKTVKEVRKKVGLVFQEPNEQLFCPTVFDDVAFGPLNLRFPKNEIRGRVEMALKLVGLEGYEERASFHLSIGERKRVAIATVLSYSPEILAFDEPSSNLDPKHRWMLINWLKSFDKTLIVATHDLDLALEVCERCVVLNNGQTVTDGRSDEILRDEDLLEKNDLELPLCLKKGLGFRI